MERRIFADPRQTILCGSPMVKAQIAARYRVADERFVVIPNGVDVDRFHPWAPQPPRAPGCAWTWAWADGPVWVLVGSGLHRKGLDTALLALARGGPRDAELWVAGKDRPDRWRSRAANLGVGARVRFLGPRSDVESVYSAADALILPTRYDAFANATLEAAASGPARADQQHQRRLRAARTRSHRGRGPGGCGGLRGGSRRAGGPGPAQPSWAGQAAPSPLGQSWLAHVAALRRLYRRIAA